LYFFLFFTEFLLFFFAFNKSCYFKYHAVLLSPPCLFLFLNKTYPDKLLRAKNRTTDPTVPPPVEARQATRSRATAPNPGGTVTWRPNRDRNKEKRYTANQMTAWIQKLNRAELTRLLNEHYISSDGTVDDLRRRLREYVRKNPQAIVPPGTEGLDTMMPREQKNPAIKVGPSFELRPPRENGVSPTSPFPPMTNIIEPARVLDQIRKWGCHFDNREPALFLERVEELRQGYQFTETHLLLGLPELLRGEPLLWARNRRHAWVTWADFCTEFRAQYYPYQYQKQMRKQRPGESYATYATALQTLARRAGNLSEPQIRELIVDNMNPSYRIYIRPTLEMPLREIAEKAVEFEGLQILERTYKSEHFSAPAVVASTYSREECCWRCKQRGHTRLHCKRPPRKFCSACGKDGVLTRDCHPARGNDSRIERPAAAARSS
jgi:hypothetical protein